MKKTLVLAILGLAGVVSSQAQGFVYLDNYNNSSFHPLITYGPGSGGTLGEGIQDGFTVGVYFGEGAFANSVAADPGGTAIPTSLHPLLQLGTGPGSTSNFILPGLFMAYTAFQASSVAARVSTFEVVAYNGSSYASSTIRGHSAAFETVAIGGNTPYFLGDYMSAFDVRGVPEPSTLTLAGLGGLILMLSRRRR